VHTRAGAHGLADAEFLELKHILEQEQASERQYAEPL
jgi:hypothetical protein